MLVTIMVLHGCTKFDTKDRSANRWHVTVISNDTECRVDIGQDQEHEFDDDSVEFEQPTGAGA